jgi:hypothetical protein
MGCEPNAPPHKWSTPQGIAPGCVRGVHQRGRRRGRLGAPRIAPGARGLLSTPGRRAWDASPRHSPRPRVDPGSSPRRPRAGPGASTIDAAPGERAQRHLLAQGPVPAPDARTAEPRCSETRLSVLLVAPARCYFGGAAPYLALSASSRHRARAASTSRWLICSLAAVALRAAAGWSPELAAGHEPRAVREQVAGLPEAARPAGGAEVVSF